MCMSSHKEHTHKCITVWFCRGFVLRQDLHIYEVIIRIHQGIWDNNKNYLKFDVFSAAQRLHSKVRLLQIRISFKIPLTNMPEHQLLTSIGQVLISGHGCFLLRISGVIYYIFCPLGPWPLRSALYKLCNSTVIFTELRQISTIAPCDALRLFPLYN